MFGKLRKLINLVVVKYRTRNRDITCGRNVDFSKKSITGNGKLSMGENVHIGPKAIID